jgi:WD40 repeat protein
VPQLLPQLRLPGRYTIPGTALSDEPAPTRPAEAIAVSFNVAAGLVATGWEMVVGKEDEVITFDFERQAGVGLGSRYFHCRVRGLALSPCGGWLAVATDSSWPSVHDWLYVWDLRHSPGRVRECPGPFGLAALTFDGRHVAACQGYDETTVRVWDHTVLPPERIEFDDEGLPLPPGATDCDVGFVPHCLASDADSSLIAVGGPGLGVYRAGAPLWVPFDRQVPTTVTALGLIAGGHFLLAGTEAGAVELWDTEAGRLVQSLTWEAGPITAVAFAPDGHTCAAGTASGQVIVWDRDH